MRAWLVEVLALEVECGLDSERDGKRYSYTPEVDDWQICPDDTQHKLFFDIAEAAAQEKAWRREFSPPLTDAWDGPQHLRIVRMIELELPGAQEPVDK